VRDFSSDLSLIDDNRLLIDDVEVTFTVGDTFYSMPTWEYADALEAEVHGND
jgi:hypothetical protein